MHPNLSLLMTNSGGVCLSNVHLFACFIFSVLKQSVACWRAESTVREIIQCRAQLLCQSIHKLTFTLLRMTGIFCRMKWFVCPSSLGKIGWFCHPINGDLLQTEAQWLHQTPQLTNSADAVLRWTECHWGMVWIQCPLLQKTHAQDTLTLKVKSLCLNHRDLLINYLWFLFPTTNPVSL